MMEKIIILFLTILGMAFMYQIKTNRSRVLSLDLGQCTVKNAINSVRLVKGALFVLVLNIFLIVSIIIFSL